MFEFWISRVQRLFVTMVALCISECLLDSQASSSFLLAGESVDCDDDGIADDLALAGHIAIESATAYPMRDITALASADLNGDSWPDLVVILRHGRVNPESGAVVSFLNDGSGNFVEGEEQTLGDHPWIPALADLDGDGDKDLAVANLDGDSVSVLANDGTGNFRRRTTIPSEGRPSQVEIARLNDDEEPDLVVLDQRTKVLRLCLRGSVNYRYECTTLSLPPSVWRIATNDVDGDGDTDVAMASDNGRIYLYHNDGTGELSNPAVIAVASSLRDLAFGDFDSDGRTDLLGVSRDDQALSIILQDATGNFTVSQTIDLGILAELVTVTDFDQDGRADWIATADGQSTVVMGLNRGATGFAVSRYAGLHSPSSHAVADFNRDGELDLVLATTSSDNQFAVFPGKPGGQLRSPSSFSMGQSGDLQLADLDRDGHSEMIRTVHQVHGTNQAAILVRQGLGKGLFAEDDRIFRLGTLGQQSRFPIQTIVFDVDNDGLLDVLTVNEGTHDLFILNGDGERLLRANRNRLQLIENVDNVAATQHESRLEALLVAAGSRARVAPRIVAYRPTGPFSFELVDLELRAPTTPGRSCLVDVDDDGDEDWVIPDALSSQLWIYRRESPLVYCGPYLVNVAEQPELVVAGDLDGDGSADLAVAHNRDDDLTVLFREAPGEFAPPLRLLAGEDPAGITLIDIDVDGTLEIAAAARSSNEIYFFESQANRSFRSSKVVAAGTSPNWIKAMCVEGEERPQIIVGSSNSPTLLRLVNSSITPDSIDCNQNGVIDSCEIASGHAEDSDLDGRPDECSTSLQLPDDCNQDGRIDVSDPICLLRSLFLPSATQLPCGESLATDLGNVELLDRDNSGRVDLSDAISVLRELFGPGVEAPRLLHPRCDRHCRRIPECPTNLACP